MSREKRFKPEAGVEQNHAVALLGKFASDPLARRVFSFVALWPKSETSLQVGVKTVQMPKEQVA